MRPPSAARGTSGRCCVRAPPGRWARPLRGRSGTIAPQPVPTYVVLLRGLNVSGHHRLPMETLRDLVASAGFGEVATYVQSGNIVCSGRGSGERVSRAIEDRLASELGWSVPVLVRSGAQLRTVLAANPFLDEGLDPVDPARHLPRRAPRARRGLGVGRRGRPAGERPGRRRRSGGLPALPGRLRTDQAPQHLPRGTSRDHGHHPQLEDGDHARRHGRSPGVSGSGDRGPPGERLAGGGQPPPGPAVAAA